MPLILSFAVNCSSTQTDTHTLILPCVSTTSFQFWQLFLYPAHPQQVSLAQQVVCPLPLSLLFSLTVCVTCAAIWPRIMSSVRYLEPVCICISSCGCWHPLQKERRRKSKNGSRPYRAGLVSCSLSWLIQLNEIPQRRHLNCLQRTHTDTGEVPPHHSPRASSSWLYASLRVSAQLIYIYVQLKCLRQCLHNLTNCKAQARHVQRGQKGGGREGGLRRGSANAAAMLGSHYRN